jgi:hypothetical protein
LTLSGQQFDGIPNTYLSHLRVRDQATINLLTQQVPNPFYPLLPGSNLSGSTVALSQLLVPYPQFTGVSEVTSEGFSSYQSLQVQVQRRFAAGMTVVGNYTWSKNMEALQFLNAGDLRPSYVISPNDSTHRVAISLIYELPFGRRKRFGSGVIGLPAKLIGGWQVAGIYQYQTGPPLGFGDFIPNPAAPSCKITLPSDQRSRLQWFNTGCFDRAVGDQLASEVRVQPLQFSDIRADGFAMLDLSIIKKIPIKERFSAEIRAEALNALNHTLFAAPNTNPTDSTFGQITASPGGGVPRTIQFGFFLRF